MKTHLTLLAACAALTAAATETLTFPLEWNPSFAGDVPYEVEIQPAKLQKGADVDPAAGFAVTADTPAGTQALPVVTLPGRQVGGVRLRFTVPSGTKSLACTAGVGTRADADSETVDNLFAGALAPAALKGWSHEKRVEVTNLPKGGVFLRGTDWGSSRVTYAVDVPPACAGRPAFFELDVTSRTKMTWGGQIRLIQFDKAGRQLAEYVTDQRWTGHMRPENRLVPYREPGRIHPDAARIVLQIEMRASQKSVDEYGLPLADKEMLLPRLEVTRLALRTAAELPFPGWRDDFFAPGVTGAAGDCAFSFDDGRAFWYQTRSWASWTQGTQLRDERLIFFPSAAGTMEAWFNAKSYPDAGGVVLMGARHHQANVERGSSYKETREWVASVIYFTATKSLEVTLKDADDKVFRKSVKTDLPTGRWFHAALCWQPGGEAVLFLDGRRTLVFPLAGYRPYDLVNTKCPNDYHCTEFYFGCHPNPTRFGNARAKEWTLFHGAGDLLRVSTGVRYAADFTPAKTFAADGDTRALFTFDRSFDGVSGGGIGWIPGTVLAREGRTRRTVAANGREIPYWPDEILPENDPDVVLNRLNYPVMPTPAEFRAARIARTKTAVLAPGERLAFDIAAHEVYPDFIEYENVSDRPLVHPLVINGGEIDPRSFGDISDSLGVESLTDRQRANAVFNFVLGASDYFMSHQSICNAWSDVPRCVEYEALVMLNSYCGFECGPLNNLAANMLATSGRCPASQTAGYGHEFEQVFYDGKNHIYDLSAQKFFPSMDNETAASLADDDNEPGIHNRLGAGSGSFIRNGNRGHYVQSPAVQPKVAMSLNPGERFKVWFANDGTVNDIQHNSRYCGNRRVDFHIAKRVERGLKPYLPFQYECSKETGLKPKGTDDVHVIDNFFPHYGNGFLVFDGVPAAANPAFCEVKDGSFCYLVQSCYPVVAGAYAVETADGTRPAIEISTDRKAFDRVGEGDAKVDYRIRSRNVFLVRVGTPLANVKRFLASTEVMVNPRILPGKVRSGANALLFKATSGAPARVTVGWREGAKEIVIRGGVYAGTIPGYERQVALLDPKVGLSLEVTGASSAAKAVWRGGVEARLADGRLTIAAGTAADGSLAAVDIVDGDALKQLTLVVASDARLLTAAEAKVFDGAKLVPADGANVQDAVWLAKKGHRARFSYPKLPAGEYVMMNLNRFPAYQLFGYDFNMRRLTCWWPESKDSWNILGGARNDAVNFFKAQYGRRGGRANWKWDFVQEPLSEYPYHLMRYIALGETTQVEVGLQSDEELGAEVGAILIIRSPTRAFKRRLMKVLCGLNCEPWRVTRD